jgi:Ca2+-binding EF-hand superfamily protein
MKKPLMMLSLAVAFGAFVAPQTFGASRATGLLQALDSDHDGTVDINEAKAAASVLFDKLDRDHDGTLDGRELKRHLSAKELAAEDSDHDGTLTKDEYLATVENRFKAADPDSDGTLDAKELNSRSGRALRRLVK